MATTPHRDDPRLHLTQLPRLTREDEAKVRRLNMAVQELMADDRYNLRDLTGMNIEFHDNGNITIRPRCKNQGVAAYAWLEGPAWLQGREDAENERPHASLELLRNLHGEERDHEPAYNDGYNFGLPEEEPGISLTWNAFGRDWHGVTTGWYMPSAGSGAGNRDYVEVALAEDSKDWINVDGLGWVLASICKAVPPGEKVDGLTEEEAAFYMRTDSRSE